MVLPSDSIFNTRIDKLPANSNSATWTPYISSVGMWFIYQWGTNVVDNSLHGTPMTFYYSTAYNGSLFQMPTVNKKREGGAYAMDGSMDHHVLSVNHQTCQFYETYQDGNPNAYCPTCNANSGYTYSSNSYSQPIAGTTDAAGLPLAPLTVHLSEILAGQINHALRFTTCVGCISSSSMWPAVSSSGGQPGAPPMGARFRLKSTFNVAAYPPAAQVVLTALQRYGMFLADVGSEGDITMSSDITEQPSVVADINTLSGQISYSDFDAVDESSLMLSNNSHQVNPANPYERPLNQALLTVTDLANPANQVVVPIVVQSATVGTPDPSIVVQAGTPAFNIPYWINGTNNHQVTWSISPATGAGTISATGAYTAPATVSSLTTTATITLTSVGDPNAAASIAVTIIPSGQIRIDSGSPVSTVDDSGNVWLPDLGFETGTFTMQNDAYGSNGAYESMPNKYIWETSLHTWGDDIVYRFHVPNGNYKIGIMNAVPNNTGTYDPTANFDGVLDLGPLNLWAQQQIGAHNFDFGVLTNHQGRTPAIEYIPAVVKDTNLIISMRVISNTFGHSIPIINGLTITPDSSAPHLAIDTQQQTSITAGTSLQLYMVNWYEPDVSYYWQMSKGPGTMKSGLFTAPASVASTQLDTVLGVGYTSGAHAYANLSVSNSQ